MFNSITIVRKCQSFFVQNLTFCPYFWTNQNFGCVLAPLHHSTEDKLSFKLMFPNRGAAAPLGAIYDAQGLPRADVFFNISLKTHFQNVVKP